MRPDFSEPCPIRFCQFISEDGDSTACPGNMIQCWTTITVKSVFLYLCGIPCLCPLNFVLSLNITEKNVPLSLLFSNLKNHTYLSSCLYITSSSPFIIFEFSGLFPVAPHPSCTVEHRTGQKTPDVASPVLSRGKGSSCLTCWQCCSQCSPKLSPLLWEGHVSDSCSACPPGPPEHSLQSCFSAWKLLKMHLCGCGFGKRVLIKIQLFLL